MRTAYEMIDGDNSWGFLGAKIADLFPDGIPKPQYCKYFCLVFAIKRLPNNNYDMHIECKPMMSDGNNFMEYNIFNDVSIDGVKIRFVW